MTGRRNRSSCSICGAVGVNSRTCPVEETTGSWMTLRSAHEARQRPRDLKELPRPRHPSRRIIEAVDVEREPTDEALNASTGDNDAIEWAKNAYSAPRAWDGTLARDGELEAPDALLSGQIELRSRDTTTSSPRPLAHRVTVEFLSLFPVLHSAEIAGILSDNPDAIWITDSIEPVGLID